MPPSAVEIDPWSHGVQSIDHARELGTGPRTNDPNTFSLRKAPNDVVHNLLCVGFGPASLAIAVALHDMLEAPGHYSPSVRFLERQAQFAWHAGMLLPGTKMQISFIKDLATLRDPTSKFTFLNYLQEHQRLVHFSNLDTFLPFRVEFEDYLKWAAGHFENVVDYNQDVQHVRPVKINGGSKFDCLEVTSRNVETGEETRLLGRNVVIAVGGRPSKPSKFSDHLQNVIHSSQYRHSISSMLSQPNGDYNIAVVGSGQSAAEIFHDLHSRYPNSKTQMIIRDTALRPSDDSPFVNEIFNPDSVDEFYWKPQEVKTQAIARNKATNYSVVRLNLLETIYEDLYHQYLSQPDKSKWQHRILTSRSITDVVQRPGNKRVELALSSNDPDSSSAHEILDVDAVILATGYVRNVHVDMLQGCQVINGSLNGEWVASRNYQVSIDRTAADNGLGIWLQGCNEQTHGLADSLLSILATRSGELVKSMFGGYIAPSKVKNGHTTNGRLNPVLPYQC